MQTTKILAITTLMLAIIGCSKQDNSVAMDKATMEPANESAAPVAAKPTVAQPTVAKPTVAKPVEMLPNEIKVEDISGTNVEQDNSGKKVLYWEDPMVEGRHFNQSGKSPFMDMQLAPRYAE